MNIQELIQSKREEILQLASQHGADNIRVFGSVVRGEADQDSDIDFLVDLGHNLSPWFPVRLIRDLEQLLGRKVDVVTEKGLKEQIRVIHLSDIKGRDDLHAPFRESGTLKLQSILDHLKGNGYQGVINFEILPDGLGGIRHLFKNIRQAQKLFE